MTRDAHDERPTGAFHHGARDVVRVRDDQPPSAPGGRAARDVVHPDERIAVLAARQHGVVSARQLRECGLSRTGIEHRAAAGRLHRLHRGIYAVGHAALPRYGHEAAALLACGRAAVLSHWSAAAAWGLASPPATVDVTLTHGDRRRPGITIHRPNRLPPGDVRTVDRLPVTAPTRTILDLAPRLDARALERLVADALARRLTTERALDARGLGRRLTAGGPRLTRSEAERELLRLICAAGLPPPQTNVPMAGFEVDVFWPHANVAVEVDGFGTHGHRIAFERDRRKDLALRAVGVTPIRVSALQLTTERDAVTATLARAVPPP